jgi:hypothetical protein
MIHIHELHDITFHHGCQNSSGMTLPEQSSNFRNSGFRHSHMHPWVYSYSKQTKQAKKKKKNSFIILLTEDNLMQKCKSLVWTFCFKARTKN